MALKWNARADIAATLIMWIGSTLAVIIAVAWLARSLTGDAVAIDQIDAELTTMEGVMATACNVDFYSNEYNPFLETGHLIVQDFDL